MTVQPCPGLCRGISPADAARQATPLRDPVAAPAAEAEACGMRFLMGTLLEIRVMADSHGNAEEAVAAAFSIVQGLDAKLSMFIAESEIAGLNRRVPQSLSAETRDALDLADRFRTQTGGAFNVNGPSGVDLGGMGKGFAMDKALEAVTRDPAVQKVRIDFGGQLLFWDRRDRVDERVIIGRDGPPGLKALSFSMRRNGSVSTSSCAERGAHLRDPRTQRGIESRRQATVIAASAAEADAWSTALFVLGPARGFSLAARVAHLEALVLEPEGGRWRVCATSGWPDEFPRFLQWETFMNAHRRRLSDLKPGQSGVISEIDSRPETAAKLMQIGLCPGEPIQVIRCAPWGGPMDVEVMGYRLAIRRSDAGAIVLQ